MRFKTSTYIIIGILALIAIASFLAPLFIFERI